MTLSPGPHPRRNVRATTFNLGHWARRWRASTTRSTREFLFPPTEPDLAMPATVMLREHGEIWRRLDAIEAELSQDGGADSLPRACHELLAVLAAHNGKEEPIFYGTADETLSASETAELKALIDSGSMPDGWVCRQANQGGPGRP